MSSLEGDLCWRSSPPNLATQRRNGLAVDGFEILVSNGEPFILVEVDLGQAEVSDLFVVDVVAAWFQTDGDDATIGFLEFDHGAASVRCGCKSVRQSLRQGSDRRRSPAGRS